MHRYWAALLRARGADILAYDYKPANAEHENLFYNHAFTEVTIGHGPEVAASDVATGRALFMAWPYNEQERCVVAMTDLSRGSRGSCDEKKQRPWDYESLRNYRGDCVCHLGELQARKPNNWRSCTTSLEFEHYLLEHFSLERVVSIPHLCPVAFDELTIWRRKG